jgi:energy-coupling factor transporter ATP-binding protein EcfA2
MFLGQVDPFAGALTRRFATYIHSRERYRRSEIHRLSNTPKALLDMAEVNTRFREVFGEPPWETLNSVLAAAKLRFRVIEPSPHPEDQLKVRLRHDDGIELGFDELSSGERILTAMSFCIFTLGDASQDPVLPELILLDEVDAPLHPSMTQQLLDVVRDVFIKTHDKRVIMTTHSPSTVALAPAAAIHLLDGRPPRLQSVSQDIAIASLTQGVPTLSVRVEDRRQVFVESPHDVRYWERIQRLVRKARSKGGQKNAAVFSLQFIQTGNPERQDVTGCDRVKDLVGDLRKRGVPSVFGIIDWDKKNRSSDEIIVIGEERRYSIENYLLDPLALAALMLKYKDEFGRYGRERFGLSEVEDFWDLEKLPNDRLQAVADAVLTAAKWDNVEERVECSYFSGASVRLPKDFLEHNGHKLSEKLRARIPEINKFLAEEADLNLAVLEKVFDSLPLLLSTDLAEPLDRISNGTP